MKLLQVVSMTTVFYVRFSLANVDEDPVVHTPLGVIRGIHDRTVLGKEIYAFLGVPYAKPPVGTLRFEAPQTMERWEGIWPATEPSSVCLQHMLNYNTTELIVGEEDCLYINIFSPDISQAARLPVLVFNHGGAFMYGNGNMFTPHFLLDRGQLVYVSVNYRLGPLGFLSTEDEVVPGNNGLKDQVMALKWVQENIAAFGGDKDKVTIGGISAGGASVHLHYMSPQSRGLFKQGISMSGTAYCPWVLAERSAEKAKQLASSVGCPTNDSRELVNCLKKRPGRKILAQLKSFWPWLTQPISPFGVVIERKGDKPFLHEHPYKLLKAGQVADLPWLTSVTSDEGLYPAAAFIDREELMKQLNDDWDRIVPHLLDYNHTITPDNMDNVSHKIREFYLGNETISEHIRENVVKMVGDRLFVASIEQAVRDQATVTKPSSVHFYEFAYQGKDSISVFISRYNSTMGVSHADDLIYILSRPILSPLTTAQDRAMMLKMTNIWVSFIVKGKPTVGINVNWDPVNVHKNTTDDFTYLLINSNTDIRQVSSPELGNRKFWDTFNFHELQNIDKI